MVVPAAAAAAGAITRQAESVRRLEAEIAGLDSRFMQASAAYDAARTKLEQVRVSIRKNTADLAKARDEFRAAQTQLSIRVSAMYRQSQPSGIEVLLRSASLSDALSRVDVMNRVQQQDVDVITTISRARERMRVARVRLAADHATSKAQSKEARLRLGEVRTIRASRRGVLLSARRQLAVMIQAEVNRQRLAALRAAQRRIVLRVGSGGDPVPAPAAPSNGGSGGGSVDVSAELQKIAQCESGGNPSAVSPSGLYRGKYQFDPQTWQSLGGSGDPATAPEAEQDRIAGILYAQRGAAPWPVCGR